MFVSHGQQPEEECLLFLPHFCSLQRAGKAPLDFCGLTLQMWWPQNAPKRITKFDFRSSCIQYNTIQYYLFKVGGHREWSPQSPKPGAHDINAWLKQMAHERLCLSSLLTIESPSSDQHAISPYKYQYLIKHTSNENKGNDQKDTRGWCLHKFSQLVQ